MLRVVYADGTHDELQYDRLCVATGARPRQLACAAAHAVLQLRDTDDVRALATRLNTARRVLLVGNGGIALELVCVRRERRWERGSALTRACFAATRSTRRRGTKWSGRSDTAASATHSSTATRCVARADFAVR